MSRLDRLRSFVNQRINAAAGDISRLLEGKIAEYEEEIRFFKEENLNLQQKLLKVTAKPDVRVFVVGEDESGPGEDEAGPSVDQENPESTQEQEPTVTPASGKSDKTQQKQPKQDQKDTEEDNETPGTSSTEQTETGEQQSTRKLKRKSASGPVAKIKRSRNK